MVTAARVRRRSHSVHAPRFALPFFASRRPCRRYLSVSVAVALCMVVAPVPVTVRTKVPRGALRLVVILRVALPGATTEVGVKLALAPFGRPLTRLRPLPEGSDVHPHILSSHPEVLYQAIVQPARTPPHMKPSHDG